jgi:hypothetical protein
VQLNHSAILKEQIAENRMEKRVSKNRSFDPPDVGRLLAGLGSAISFAALGVFLLAFAASWEWLVIGARNGTAIGSCDFVGSTSLLGGIGLLGAGLLWIAGLIARSIVWHRPASSSTWANVIMLFLLATGMTLYGYFFGDGCAVIN